MKSISKYFLFCSFVVAVTTYQNLNKQFTYSYDDEGFQIRSPENSPIHLGLQRSKFNRSAYHYDLNLTITDVIDARYYVWGSGGWKQNFLNMERRNPCAQLKFMYGPQFAQLMKDWMGTSKCPYQPGVYLYSGNVWFNGSLFNTVSGRTKYISQILGPKKELVLSVEKIGTIRETVIS